MGKGIENVFFLRGITVPSCREYSYINITSTMKRLTANHKQSKTFWLALATPLLLAPTPLLAMGNADETAVVAQQTQPIVGVEQINPTTVDILFADGRRMTFDFYGENIFRMFQDNNGVANASQNVLLCL